MSERVCSIGVDFGTESGRALLMDGIGEAVHATRPADARAYAPDRASSETSGRVDEIYRGLYETLGRSQVALLPGLKRIATETRRAT